MLCLLLLRRFLVFFLFFFYCSGDHRDLHSFPTRRSSDLRQSAGQRRHEQVGLRAAHGGEAVVVLGVEDRKSTRLNSSHSSISYAVFCLKKKTGIAPAHTLPYKTAYECDPRETANTRSAVD